MNLKGQRIAILGAGGSGFAAATLALACGAQVEAYDSGDTEKLKPAVEQFQSIGVKLTTGDAALEPEGRFHQTVMSPGIALYWAIAQTFAAASDELIGEIEFAYRAGNANIIAITGTNGKTTTTALITEMLKGAGLRAVAAGNIGLPFSEVVASGETYDWVVLELSSFQLETISSFQAPIAIWLNFAPDHMDRYRSLEEYRAAKERIFLNRPEGALAIIRHGMEAPRGWECLKFSAFDRAPDFFYAERAIRRKGSDNVVDFSQFELQGLHNAENVMVALAVAEKLSLPLDSVLPSLSSFQAPAHRCEKVGEKDGVTFVNDSKSTNLHSLESALAGQETPVVLIAGGKEKGLNFSTLNDLVSEKVKHAVCIGEIASQIAAEWGEATSSEIADSLNDAVNLALNAAAPGDVVLFSPGTSSFDMFTGYEARGNAFRESVSLL